MSKPLEFILKMIDKVSPSAKKASSSLSGVSGSMKKAQKGASGFMMGLGASAAGFAIGLVKSGVDAVIAGAKFKDSMKSALSLYEDSAAQVNKTYNRIEAIAKLTPFDLETTGNMMMGLRQQGLSQKTTEGIVGVISDLASATPGNKKENAARISHAVNMMIGKGAVSLEMLQGIPGGVKKFTEAYARLNKKSLAQAQNELSKGKIKSAKAMAVLVDMATMGGKNKIGDMTKKMGLETLDGQLASLTINIQKLFNFNTAPVVGLLMKINELFDGPMSKSIKKFSSDFVTDLVTPVMWFIKPWRDLFVMTSLGSYIFDGLGKVLKMTGAVVGTLIGALASGIIAIALAVAMLGKFVWAIPWALKKAWDAMTASTKFMGEAIGWAIKFGADLVSGIIKGIVDSVPRMIESTTDALGSVQDAWNDLFGRRSPSKWMQDFMSDVVKGGEIGVDKNIGRLGDSVQAIMPTKPVGGSSAGRGPITLIFNVDGSKSPQATARAVRSELSAYFLEYA